MVRSVQKLRARLVASCGLGEFRVTESGHAIADGGAPRRTRRVDSVNYRGSSRPRNRERFVACRVPHSDRHRVGRVSRRNLPAFLIAPQCSWKRERRERKERTDGSDEALMGEFAIEVNTQQRLQLLLRTGLMLRLRRQRDAYPTDACACAH
jgi:hypothetical protein